jgi:ribonucleoside-diphosphate reductase alpha chain
MAEGGATPVVDAMFSRNEPRTGTSGTLAWAVDVDNPATNEQFTLTLKEVLLPTPGSEGSGGSVTRPCAMGFSGNYPKALDGLARLLSLDMRVMDPGWIAMKLRKLLNVGEPLGHFMAPVPSLHGADARARRQQVWPSTVAYVARLVIHRYAMLGILDEAGQPLTDMGLLQTPAPKLAAAAGTLQVQAGRPCPECGNATMIHKDGCDFCTACGYVGQCG